MVVHKVLRAVLIRIAALLAILVAFTLAINLSSFDEELHPDLIPLMSPEPVSMEDNAYPLIYGFTTSSDRDSLEAGLEIVGQLRERYEPGEPLTLTNDEMARILGSDDDEVWMRMLPSTSCYMRDEIDCADRMIAEVANADLEHPRLQVLLERYEAILGAARFEEIQELEALSPFPSRWRPVMAISRIHLAVSYETATTAEFLSVIGEDIAFWKTLLRDGQSLLTKMSALWGLRNDTQFLSALIRNRDLDDAELRAIPRVLPQLTDIERNIGDAFLAEIRLIEPGLGFFRWTLHAGGLHLHTPPLLAQFTLQERATINEYYLTMVIPLRLLASLSADEFYRQRGFQPLDYEIRIMPPPLYNLSGKAFLLTLIAPTNPQDYISRVHDLDGRIAAVLLQAEIAGNPSRSVAEIIDNSSHRNPYTLEPMDYDPEAGTLGFECLSMFKDLCVVMIEAHRG